MHVPEGGWATIDSPSGLALTALPAPPGPGHASASTPAWPPHEHEPPLPKSSSALSPPVPSLTFDGGTGEETGI